jgi:hypothetical protein
VFTNTFNIVPNIYNVSLNITMHLPVLSRYTFNILYNVLIRQKIMRNSNVDKYRKVIVWHEAGNLRRLQPLHHVFIQSKMQSSERTIVHLQKVVVTKKTINKILAYWILLARQVRATTKNDEQ